MLLFKYDFFRSKDRKMRENPWFPSNSASAFNPQLLTTGENRRLVPSDPPDPDPDNPLSLTRFPPLNSPTSKSPKTTRGLLKSPLISAAGSSSPVTAPTVSSSSLSTTPIEVPTATPTPLASSVATVSRYEGTVQLNLENFKILPPKFSSPIQTNKASRNPPPLPPSLPKNSKHIVSPYC